MRHRSRLARLLIIATIMISMLTPQLVLAEGSSMDNPTATDVNYSKDGDKRTGIKTFTIDPYTYYNVKLNKKDFSILNEGDRGRSFVSFFHVFYKSLKAHLDMFMGEHVNIF